MNKGLISQIFDWGIHPMNSDSNTSTWLAFLVLILIVSFLWSTVVRSIQT